MAISSWTFVVASGGTKTVSNADKYVIKKISKPDEAGNPGPLDMKLEFPLLFKIDKSGQGELYGYLDYESILKSKDIDETKLTYIIKKCSSGLKLLERDSEANQGVVYGESKSYKIKFLIGDIRLHGYKLVRHGNKQLIIIDSVFKHGSVAEKAFHGKKKLSEELKLEKYEEVVFDEEAKGEGVGYSRAASPVSPEALIKYALAYDSELLELILEDQEFTSYITGESNDGRSILHLLIGMLDATTENKTRYIEQTPKEGVTLAKWENLFKIALSKLDPDALTPEGRINLLDAINKSQLPIVLTTLQDNANWRARFHKIVGGLKENPLRIFFNPVPAAKSKLDVELFEFVVNARPQYLLSADYTGVNYFTRLAIYLENYKDNRLQALFKTQLSLLHGNGLEELVLHYVNQETFKFEHCIYLGLQPPYRFQPATNKPIVQLINAEVDPDKKIALIEFFYQGLGQNGMSSVLERLIEPSTINTYDQMIVRLFGEISSKHELFIDRFNQYLDNGGSNSLIYHKFLDTFKGNAFERIDASKLLHRLVSIGEDAALIRSFDDIPESTAVKIFNEYLANDWSNRLVYYKFLDRFKGKVFNHVEDAPKLFYKVTSFGENAPLTNLMNEIPQNIFINIFKQYLDNSGSNRLIYDKFIDTFKSDIFQHVDAFKLFIKVLSFEKDASLIRLFSVRPQDVFVGVFKQYLNNEGANSLVYSKFLDTFKGNTFDHVDASQLFQRIASLKEDALLIQFLQHLDDLKRIEFSMPAVTEADSEGLKMLSLFYRVGAELTKEEAIYIMQASGRQIVDFCLKQGKREELSIAIFVIYRARVQLVELSLHEAMSMFVMINNLYGGREHQYGPEILQFIQVLAIKLNKYKSTMKQSMQHDIEILLRNLKYNLQETKADSAVAQISLNQEQVKLKGADLLVVLKAARVLSISANTVSQGIEVYETGDPYAAAEIGINTLLLFCILRPNHVIARYGRVITIAAKFTIDLKHYDLLTATIGAISNTVASYFSAISRFFYQVNQGLSNIFLGIATCTEVYNLYSSGIELGNKIASYKERYSNNKPMQCEILTFSEHKYDRGSAKAILDIFDELIARGYRTFVFDESLASNTRDVIEENVRLIRGLTTSLNKAISYSEEEKRLQEDTISAFQAVNDLLDRIASTAGTSAHHVVWQSTKDVISAERDDGAVKKVKELCAQKPEYGKQVFLGTMGIMDLIPSLRESNFKVLGFTVWDTKEVCDESLQSSIVPNRILKGIKEDNKLYKCVERRRSYPTDMPLFNVSEVFLLDHYKYNQLNVSAEILEFLDSNVSAELWSSARAGDKEEQYKLAVHFLKESKAKEARLWHRKAAKQGFAPSQAELAALLIEIGKVVEAKEWAQKAIEQGSIRGQEVLGMILEKGGNLDGAENLYKKAADKGSEGAKQKLEELRKKIMQDRHRAGIAAKKEGRLDEAERLFRQSAEEDFGDSQAELAFLLFETKKTLEAKHWTEKIFEKGMKEGQYLKADLLREEGDLVGAKELLKLSAKQGFELAKKMISGIDKKLSGLEGNAKEQHAYAADLMKKGKIKGAEYWYREAAKLGFAPSQAALVPILIKAGKKLEAKEWAEKCAERGEPEAQNQLGKILEENGNLDGAKIWYDKANKQGIAEAQWSFIRVSTEHAKLSNLEGVVIKFDEAQDSQSKNNIAGQEGIKHDEL